MLQSAGWIKFRFDSQDIKISWFGTFNGICLPSLAAGEAMLVYCQPPSNSFQLKEIAGFSRSAANEPPHTELSSVFPDSDSSPCCSIVAEAPTAADLISQRLGALNSDKGAPTTNIQHSNASASAAEFETLDRIAESARGAPPASLIQQLPRPCATRAAAGKVALPLLNRRVKPPA